MKTVIEATKISPRVEFNSDGELSFLGRSIIEDTTVFFMPIIDWVKSLTCSKITVTVRMEYMNTSSSKQLLTVLKALVSNDFLETINVKWFYEEDDEDMLDMGKDYESLIRIPFDFFELSSEIA